MATTASPNYVVLRGASHYLRRASNDTSLDPLSNALTVSVTIDPEAAGTVTNGTIAGKYRTDNNQRGWRVEYVASTQKVKCTVYGLGDGSISIARETNTVVTYRRNITFTFGLINGLHAYLDGAADDGTSTVVGVLASLVSSTEPLGVGVDSFSGTPANVWKGSIYMIAVAQVEATAGNVSGMAGDGLLNAALAGLANLTAYWRHLDIATNPANVFTAWVDNKSSLALTATGTVLGQQASGTAILTFDLWDANLSQLAFGSSGLSSTYSLSAPYRLWGAGLNEPQITTSYRSYRGDFTAVIRARRVAGRSTSNIFRKRGIFMQYILSSQELYIIVGDDNVGSTNKRISWGVKLFPVEGIDAVFVLRYNAVDKDADLFINQIAYAHTANISTPSNELTTGLFLGESTDWQSCAITYACLSDAQVDTFVLGLAQNAYPVGVTGTALVDYLDYARDPSAEADLAAIGALTADANVLEDESNVVALGPPILDYADAATTPKTSTGNILQYETQVDDYIYTDPNVVIDSASYVSGVVTVTGHAGPIEGEAVRAWAEIEVVSGQFQGVGAVQFPVALKTRQAVSFTFQTTPGFDAGGYNVRIAIQPQENARRVYRSSSVALSIVLPTDPLPTMVSAPINSTADCTATVNAGPTNAGTMTLWFEEETSIGSGTYTRVSGFGTGIDFSLNTNHALTFSLGSRTGHTGRRLRAVLQQESNPIVTFTSAGLSLTDYSYVSPAPSVQSVSVTPARVVTATGRAGPTDVGTCSTWWDLEISAGVFDTVIAKRTGIDFTVQTDITDTFTIPQNFSLTGKKLRFVVQPDADPGAPFSSADYTMSDASLTNPLPAITVATCSLTKLLALSATLVASNAGPATIWWEVENDPGEWTSILDTTASVSLASPQTRTLSYQLPTRLDLTGKNVRLAVQSSVVPAQIWYSSSTAITQTSPIVPTLNISAASEDDLGIFASTASIGATNLGNVIVSWQVDVLGDFKTIFEQSTIATSSSVSTPVTASVSLPNGLNVVGKTCRLVVTSVTFPELTYASSPFTVTSAASSPPNPVVTAASVSAGGTFSLQGTAGPSSISSATVWFEVDTIGGALFDGRFGSQVLDLTGSTTVTATVGLQGRMSLTGKTVRMRIQPASRPDIVYDSAPFSITTATYVDPLPAVSAASVNTSNVLTATGACGVSDIGAYHFWWEVEITANKFVALFDKQVGPSMAASRQTVTASVNPLPARFDLTGKSVRLAIQQDSRPDNVYYSSTFSITTPTIVPPSMSVTAANVSITDIFTATVVLGANNLGNVKTWWEVEVTTNEFTALFDTVTPYALPSGGATVNGNSPLPSRFDLTGKSVRFAVQWIIQPENIYYSSTFPITAANVTDPAPLIQTFSIDVWGDCSGTARVGPTNAAFCDVWWEIAVDPGGGFVAVLDTVSNVNLFTQQILSGSFILPRGEYGVNYDFTTKYVRVAVRPNNRPELVYYSPQVSLAAAARIDPEPTVTRVYPLTHAMVVQGQAGPTNMGNFMWWVEIEYDTDHIVFTEQMGPVSLAGVFTVNITLPIPSGWNFNFKRLRLAFAPTRDPASIYYSDWYVLGEGFDNSGHGDATPAPVGGGVLNSPLPKGPGIWRRQVRDFS